jgi:hypothetical protein
MPMIPPFERGDLWQTSKRKLDEIVRRLNGLERFTGDRFINVHQGPYGVALGLNVDQIMPMVPRAKKGQWRPFYGDLTQDGAHTVHLYVAETGKTTECVPAGNPTRIIATCATGGVSAGTVTVSPAKNGAAAMANPAGVLTTAVEKVIDEGTGTAFADLDLLGCDAVSDANFVRGVSMVYIEAWVYFEET